MTKTTTRDAIVKNKTTQGGWYKAWIHFDCGTMDSSRLLTELMAFWGVPRGPPNAPLYQLSGSDSVACWIVPEIDLRITIWGEEGAGRCADCEPPDCVHVSDVVLGTDPSIPVVVLAERLPLMSLAADLGTRIGQRTNATRVRHERGEAFVQEGMLRRGEQSAPSLVVSLDTRTVLLSEMIDCRLPTFDTQSAAPFWQLLANVCNRSRGHPTAPVDFSALATPQAFQAALCVAYRQFAEIGWHLGMRVWRDPSAGQASPRALARFVDRYAPCLLREFHGELLAFLFATLHKRDRTAQKEDLACLVLFGPLSDLATLHFLSQFKKGKHRAMVHVVLDHTHADVIHEMLHQHILRGARLFAYTDAEEHFEPGCIEVQDMWMGEQQDPKRKAETQGRGRGHGRLPCMMGATMDDDSDS
jgi:hypothetical protein